MGFFTGSGSYYCGTTYNGGADGYGAVFKMTEGRFVNTLTTVASFNKANGANPYGGLAETAAEEVCGTTVNGGAYGYGTVFEVTSSGAISTLVSFNNTDGANPIGGLVYTGLWDENTLYGTTSTGGAYGYGTIFELTFGIYPTTFTKLASFNNTNGANPCGTMFLDGSGNLLWGHFPGRHQWRIWNSVRIHQRRGLDFAFLVQFDQRSLSAGKFGARKGWQPLWHHFKRRSQQWLRHGL